MATNIKNTLEELKDKDESIKMDKLIRKFINQEITLSQKDISQSAKSREWFLNKVKNKIDSRVREPTLYSKPFIYFGSYFKGTKVKDVDEYDVLVIIDSNYGRFTQKGLVTGEGLGRVDPNHKYDQKYIKSDGSGVSPSKLLNWLKGIVEEVVSEFGGTAPVRNGQAIIARIESRNIDIDLVPAGIFQHTQKADTTFYNIPRGDKDNGWIVTNPTQDIQLINDFAVGRDNFRNIIRLVKYIRNSYNIKISSFAIECCIVNYASEGLWVNNAYVDLIGVLILLMHCLKTRKLLDTFDETNNLFETIDSAEWYAQRIENIIDGIEAILSKDDAEAYEKLVKIFGNK